MNLLVISHRRSGTHLTIDSLLNNSNIFDKTGKGYEIIDFNAPESIDIQKLNTIDNRIIKTHILPDLDIYNIDEKDKKTLLNFIKQTPKIYVYRNGLDVMISLYHYMKNYDPSIKNISFEQFLQTKHNFDPLTKQMDRSQFWAYHIEQWQNFLIDSKNILWLKYEDWLSNYTKTLTKISKFFNIPLNKKIVDIRIKNSFNIKNKKLIKLLFDIKKKFYKLIGRKFTAVLPREGKSEQFYQYFDEKTLKLIHHSAIDIMEELGYKITI